MKEEGSSHQYDLSEDMKEEEREEEESLFGRAESGGIVLATAYWATSVQGGVTRRGVVLTYRLSLVIGSQ